MAWDGERSTPEQPATRGEGYPTMPVLGYGVRNVYLPCHRKFAKKSGFHVHQEPNLFFRNTFARIWLAIDDASSRAAGASGSASGAATWCKALSKQVADLEKTVSELREAHNELYRYDVSKRFQVFNSNPVRWTEPNGDLNPVPVARLAKTHPYPEPIPVQPAKRKR